MKRIGIIGLGNKASQHIKRIQKIKDFELIGLYDHNTLFAHKIAHEFGIKSFPYPIDIIENSQAIDFISPHPMDSEHINLAIKNARHVFLENDFLKTAQQTKKLHHLVDEAQVKVQIAWQDRLNPAVIKARKYINQAHFIETRRAVSNMGNQQSSDSAMDLLLQDLDLVMSFVDSGIRRIQTRTNNPFSEKVELINVRIEFDNACVANLNISSLSPTSYTKAAIYQENAVVHIDLQKPALEILRSKEQQNDTISLNLNEDFPVFDPLYNELESFNQCIEHNTSPIIGLDEAYQVLEIMDEIKAQLGSYH